MKMPCGDPKAACRAAILDPELTVTMPHAVATVTGVKLTRRPLRFDGRRSAAELHLPPRRSCRDAIAEAVEEYRAYARLAPDEPDAQEMRERADRLEQRL